MAGVGRELAKQLSDRLIGRQGRDGASVPSAHALATQVAELCLLHVMPTLHVHPPLGIRFPFTQRGRSDWPFIIAEIAERAFESARHGASCMSNERTSHWPTRRQHRSSRGIGVLRARGVREPKRDFSRGTEAE